MYTTLISANQLQHLLASGPPAMVFDCSFDLGQPEAGLAQYAQSHLPHAVYAHLDTALSAPRDPITQALPREAASGGRHPLPSREKFAVWLASVGFSKEHQAVVYDRQGTTYCGRMWWMLKWLGHENVAVLDGGLQAWVAAGGTTQTGAATPAQSGEALKAFTLQAPLVDLRDVASVQTQLTQAGQTVLDARGAPRFRGEVEPLDPVAGHLPGALNRPFTQNLGEDGLFKPAAVLRAEFQALLGQRDPASVVHQCGSGVTAVSNLLAMEVAGLGRTALFAGSWSEWCSDPARPVAQG
jgi:thiosulfate/3-mercaptopyruvate sulfurtransferase